MEWRLHESPFMPVDQFYVVEVEPGVRLVVYSRPLLLLLWRQYVELCLTTTGPVFLPPVPAEELLLGLAKQRVKESEAALTEEQRRDMVAAYRDGAKNLLKPLSVINLASVV